jgi:hypothetical protein
VYPIILVVFQRAGRSAEPVLAPSMAAWCVTNLIGVTLGSVLMEHAGWMRIAGWVIFATHGVAFLTICMMPR